MSKFTQQPAFLFLIALVCIGSFWYWRDAQEAHDGTGAFNEGIEAGLSAPLAPPFPGWKEYRNKRFEFLAFHPKEMVVKELSEEGGGMTITFENEKALEGFQIFVSLYNGTQVSEERFRRDVPSGVRNLPKDMLVDGAAATSFYSEDLALGETYEIWFLREGFLYELTTLKSQESLLNKVAEGWQFLERGIR